MWQLYQFPLCPFSRKVRLQLEEKGIGYELVPFEQHLGSFARVHLLVILKGSPRRCDVSIHVRDVIRGALASPITGGALRTLRFSGANLYRMA